MTKIILNQKKYFISWNIIEQLLVNKYHYYDCHMSKPEWRALQFLQVCSLPYIPCSLIKVLCKKKQLIWKYTRFNDFVEINNKVWKISVFPCLSLISWCVHLVISVTCALEAHKVTLKMYGDCTVISWCEWSEEEYRCVNWKSAHTSRR